MLFVIHKGKQNVGFDEFGRTVIACTYKILCQMSGVASMCTYT